MKKFLTSVACAVTMLAVIPACAKKVAKQEPVNVAENKAVESLNEDASNDKENYSV